MQNANLLQTANSFFSKAQAEEANKKNNNDNKFYLSSKHKGALIPKPEISVYEQKSILPPLKAIKNKKLISLGGGQNIILHKKES